MVNPSLPLEYTVFALDVLKPCQKATIFFIIQQLYRIWHVTLVFLKKGKGFGVYAVRKQDRGNVREKLQREERESVTWTMATRKRTPLSPTAMEATAITAGPVRNLTAIEKAAMLFPHAIIFGCKAMNNPAIHTHTFIITPPLPCSSPVLCFSFCFSNQKIKES